MSCGEHHDVDCSEILQRVYVFIDNELEDASTDEIRQHLEECAPCLDQYDLERSVKKLVGRCCGDEHAPDSLRAKILLRLTELRVEITTTD
ncbi:mycothiol system anti-sigma-R factor [Kribbella qitaiheensis]|uniref:Mycothiol system anti-sigma-R factor n=1 Tax=Kribbella qitaiheensis TaxID=1544730 RepID=A0A7G6WVH2_9ACTN|nr:mycothiol system anti-sigma-R factor [Kribbella qitaiheensis]QNE17987.1 mycothiol system anti-sigma-R factor [Kribbella qitaiheensis]